MSSALYQHAHVHGVRQSIFVRFHLRACTIAVQVAEWLITRHGLQLRLADGGSQPALVELQNNVAIVHRDILGRSNNSDAGFAAATLPDLVSVTTGASSWAPGLGALQLEQGRLVRNASTGASASAPALAMRTAPFRCGDCVIIGVGCAAFGRAPPPGADSDSMFITNKSRLFCTLPATTDVSESC